VFESKVFDRSASEASTLGGATYNMVIGLVLMWGFFINWLIVREVDPQALRDIHPLLFYGGYFVCCMIGIWMFSASANPLISFLGYNLVVIPFGFIVNLVVSRYQPELVVQAMQVTGGATAIMMLLGSLFPRFFAKIHLALVLALLAVIIVELVQIFVFKMHSDWIDWVVAVIFCGYIGYDWGRANRIAKTLDNAIDSAAAIYRSVQ
jgi:FtsH-binding integral membrane protein